MAYMTDDDEGWHGTYGDHDHDYGRADASIE